MMLLRHIAKFSSRAEQSRASWSDLWSAIITRVKMAVGFIKAGLRMETLSWTTWLSWDEIYDTHVAWIGDLLIWLRFFLCLYLWKI